MNESKRYLLLGMYQRLEMLKLANPNRSEPRFKIKAHLNFAAKLTNKNLWQSLIVSKYLLGNEIRKIGYRIIWSWEILYQNWSNPVIALSEMLGCPDLNRPISAFLFTYYVLGYGWQKFRWYFVHIWPLLFHKKAIYEINILLRNWSKGKNRLKSWQKSEY